MRPRLLQLTDRVPTADELRAVFEGLGGGRLDALIELLAEIQDYLDTEVLARTWPQPAST